MRHRTKRTGRCILGIAPSSRGFGYGVLEGGETLVDWGVGLVSGDKNAGTLKKVAAMIAHYKPSVLVLEDAAAKESRRSRRIRDLNTKLIGMAMRHKIRVRLISRNQLKRAFFEDGQGTKHTIARILALRFPDELGHRLPPKRKPWGSESYRMGMFDAVALAFAKELPKRRVRLTPLDEGRKSFPTSATE